MDQSMRDVAAAAAADWNAAGGYSGHSLPPCSVWSHPEHQDLQVRYSKALEDLSAARHEVIRLTQEMAGLQPPSRRRSSPLSNGDLSVNGSDHQLLPLPQPPQQQQTRTGSHAPLHPRPVLGPLISRPPQDDKLRNYYAEVEGWVRPMWLPEQLAMVPNYLSSQAVVTNLRNVMYGLDGSVPSPGDWKMWCADRLAVVKDILDPGKTWRQQLDEHKRLAIAVLEKRWPALTLCEPDLCWKASQFLSKRVEEVIKVQHQEQRAKLQRESENQNSGGLQNSGLQTGGGLQNGGVLQGGGHLDDGLY